MSSELRRIFFLYLSSVDNICLLKLTVFLELCSRKRIFSHIFRAKWRLLSLLDNLEFMHHVSLRALRTPIGLVYSYDAYKFPLSETTHFSFVFSLDSFRTMYFPFSRQCHSKSSTPVKWSGSNFLNNLISQIFQDVLNPSSLWCDWYLAVRFFHKFLALVVTFSKAMRKNNK